MTREVARKFNQLYCGVNPRTDDKDYVAKGGLFPVIEAKLRYKGAARYDDVLHIELWLTELERVRMNFACRRHRPEQTF